MNDPRAAWYLFPTGAAFVDQVAIRLVALHRDRLPDLSHLTLVVASPLLLRPLREALARAAGGALLMPRLLSLSQLAASERDPEAPAPLTPLACRLQLAAWLARLSSVFPGRDPVRVADALFNLFEELSLNAVPLPTEADAFAEQLRAAYAAPELDALSREAQLVHQLWRAYTDEIGDRAPAVAHLRALRQACAAMHDTVLIGHDQLGRAEATLLAPALLEGRAMLWTRGRREGHDGDSLRLLAQRLGIEPVALPPIGSARGALLDSLFDTDDTPLLRRAARLSGQGPTGVRLVAARSPEHEARIVELAVREALLAGYRDVVVVSGDRRLARRVRALLERAGIALDDRIGWTLSTSRAAATVAAWLECLETGFHYRPLLDLLKSGFFVGEPVERPEPPLAALLDRLLHFPPRDHADVPRSGLPALQGLAENRWPALFERLQRAAHELPVTGAPRPAVDWARATLASLVTVGLAAGLAEDAAGSQVVAALRQLEQALDGVPLRQSWREFRALLDQHLETSTFRPDVDPALPRVPLVTLDQTAGLSADVIVLASATRAALPGAAPGEVLFNHAVRGELGLDGWPMRQAPTLSRLRALLEAAPSIVASFAADEDGDAPQPSPWLEAFAAQAVAAGHDTPLDERLAARAGTAATQVAPQRPIDVQPMAMPAPPADAALLPVSLSAGGHQQLIDCPYRWYANRQLRLDAGHDPDADPNRSDYGDRVHRILCAFHAQHEDALPPPYAGAADATAIAAHLARLADAVFAPDLAARPLAAVWRREFAAVTPWLAEQLAERLDARIEVEVDLPRERAGWQIGGRVDRVEHRDGGATIVDYKTGRAAEPADIVAGEAVQLPHYALAIHDPAAIEYWRLGGDLAPHKRVVTVPDETLTPLLAAIETRLQSLRTRLAAGHAMPANGTAAICEHCDHSGLCRRGTWIASP